MRTRLTDLLGENCRAIAEFGKENAAGETGHAGADDCDVLLHSSMVGTDRRAVRKIVRAPGRLALPR